MVHVVYAVNDGIVVDLSTGKLQVINANDTSLFTLRFY